MSAAAVPTRFTALTGPRAGTEPVVGVGVEIHLPDGHVMECGAAPLLTAALRRADVAVEEMALRQVTDRHRRPDDLMGWLVSAAGPDRGSEAVFAMALAGQRVAVHDTVLSVMAEWMAVVGPREVLLAEPRSFCAGVERAIEVVERVIEMVGPPVYVRKQVVHNIHVVRDLEQRGAVFVAELDEVPRGATVVFSAHGVSPAVRAEAEARELDVIDATCPLVTKVHVEARRFAERGDTVVLIGHHGHEETEGTMGEAPDRVVLISDPDDVAHLRVADPRRVSYLTQTTLAVDETAEVVDALRQKFPALRGPRSDDICYATTNRQNALRAVARDADVVLVLGSTNSSNSVRLVELSNRQGTPAHLIDDVSEIRAEWLAGAGTVGLTAGASAPPRLVDEVVRALGGLGPVTVGGRHVTTETTEFLLPRAVRRS